MFENVDVLSKSGSNGKKRVFDTFLDTLKNWNVPESLAEAQKKNTTFLFKAIKLETKGPYPAVSKVYRPYPTAPW